MSQDAPGADPATLEEQLKELQVHRALIYLGWLFSRVVSVLAWVQIAVATLSGNSLRQTAHTHYASVHQAAKLVAALLRVSGDNCRPGGK